MITQPALKNYNLDPSRCKICGSKNLKKFAHTATCIDCGVLINYPYAPVREENYLNSQRDESEKEQIQYRRLLWHVASGERNHHNFTNMALFTLSNQERERPLDILDYGGGGGQFALVVKSLFPNSKIWIVDMEDDGLLHAFRPLNQQIPFTKFLIDEQKFDVIFMNDVFEHLTFPTSVLKELHSKLKSNGKIFIDTPYKFWGYYALKYISPSLQSKFLRGTVDSDHQQIWSKKSFYHVATLCDFSISKYKTCSEYTQGATFYLDNMDIRSKFLRLGGYVFFSLSRWIARNKIMAVLQKNS